MSGSFCYIYHHNEPKRAPVCPVILFVLGLIASFIVMPAYAHDEAILKCSNNVLYKSVKKLSENRLANGLIDEHYDSNDDEKVDIHVLSSIKGPSDEYGFTPHDPNPVFWIVDLDLDGKEDMIYIDKHGEGNCNDIVPYLGLNRGDLNPESPNPDDKRDADRRQM